jgi:hypothetical protein
MHQASFKILGALMGPRDLPSSAIKLKKNRGGEEDLIIYVSFHRFKTAYLKNFEWFAEQRRCTAKICSGICVYVIWALLGNQFVIDNIMIIQLFPICQNCRSVAYIWYRQSSLFA